MPHDSPLKYLSSGVQGDVFLAAWAAQPTGLAVVKVVHAPKDGDSASLRPHNVVREARVLRENAHNNIVAFVGYTFDVPTLTHRLVLEALPLRLSDVLVSTRASPVETQRVLFCHAARGVFSALAFLHARGIAHRDIKPPNILYASDGTPKLIDLATAWGGGTGAGDDGEGGMTCSVGTGGYRAPELLFGPEHYDAPALDLWGAGATLAEFFRPTRGTTSSSAGSSDHSASSAADTDEEDEDDAAPPAPLFDASFGDIGLAGSIFRLLGTPTQQTWPTFDTLPDAGKVPFIPRAPRPLSSELDVGDGADGDAVLCLLQGLLRLGPSQRTPAAEVVAALADDSVDNAALDILRPWLQSATAAWQDLRCNSTPP